MKKSVFLLLFMIFSLNNCDEESVLLYKDEIISQRWQETLTSSRNISSSPSLTSSRYPCNIEILDLLSPYPNERVITDLSLKPILFKGLSNRNYELQSETLFDRIIEDHGEIKVILSSSNTYSHEKITMSLKQYLETMNQQSSHSQSSQPSDSPQSSQSLSNETYYLFGNNHNPIFKHFEELYHLPPCSYCSIAGAVTIGIGGENSGVSFHYHGPGYIEVIHGSKRFFLYPLHVPLSDYQFDPNMTQAEWVERVYPIVKKTTELYECELFPGDILYFPDRWYHGTLNTDPYTFFVSLFIDPQLIQKKENSDSEKKQKKGRVIQKK